MILVFAKDRKSFILNMGLPNGKSRFMEGGNLCSGVTIYDDDILYFTGDYKENPDYDKEFVCALFPQLLGKEKLFNFFKEKFEYLFMS